MLHFKAQSPFSRTRRTLDISGLIPSIAVVVTLVGACRVDAQQAPAPTDASGPALRADVVSIAAYAQLFAVEPIVPPDPAILLEDWQQATPQTVPPKHTGFAALARGIGSDFAWFPRRKSTYVILGIGGAAAALAHPLDDNIEEGVKDNDGLRKAFAAGKYIGAVYTQAGVAVGMYVIGRYFMKPQSNRMSHLGFDIIRGLVLSQVLTQGVKVAVQRDRPTGECCAFPSGHASAAFATASVLERHFGYRGAWPTFVIGGYVAASRLFDNRHFLSDVVFGSALGIASGWTVVGRHGRNDFTMMPTPRRGGMGVTFVWTPGGPGAPVSKGANGA
jgi:PAP2 superfamily